MSPRLPFTPRYHALTEGPTGPVWVPMYNPVRECVQAESCRIRGEFGRVDTHAWQRPRRQRAGALPVLAQLGTLIGFLLAALSLGWALVLAGPLAQVVNVFPAERQPAALMVIGGVFLLGAEVVLALVRARRRLKD